MLQPPVILVPGISATGLEDFYPLPPRKVWSALWHHEYDSFGLHPDNGLFEAEQPSLLKPAGLFSLVYRDFAQALRAELGEPGRETPVFPFAYDWRRPLAETSRELAEFVQEVSERCRLMSHYQRQAPPVDLVGHSMGGLILAGCLASGKAAGKIRKAVSLGAPFKGSVDALLKLVIGKGSLFGQDCRDRERVAARTIPAVYHLLPRYRGAVQAISGAPVDLFTVDTWQGSLLKSLGEFIRAHGAETSAKELLSGHLGRAKEFLECADGLDLTQALPDGRDGWLCIAGVGSPTQQEVQNRPLPAGGTRFRVMPDADDWRPGRAGERTGDGTVPFLGACPAFLPREKLVCVSPRDFSRWELKDLLLARAVEFHAFLPAVNLVQRLVIGFLKPSYGGEVWGWPPPGVKPREWRPPLELELRETLFG